MPRLTAFYARLTREDAASASIENQAAGFEDLRRRHGWTAQHYVEQGRRASGEWTPARRPALYQLLEAVERGEVERPVPRSRRVCRAPVRAGYAVHHGHTTRNAAQGAVIIGLVRFLIFLVEVEPVRV